MPRGDSYSTRQKNGRPYKRGVNEACTGLSISARSVYLPIPVLPHVSPPVFISALNFITRAQFHTRGRVEIEQENRQSSLAGY